ncbi:MAG: HD-GYP domain-containing protein, partial [Candidatus Syntrophonatronum acetioxidans]
VLKKSCRQTDFLARIGGDEFVIVLPRTSEEEGEQVGNRIRSNLDLYNVKDPSLPMSLSLGIATAETRKNFLHETYKRADNLMCRAKLSKDKGSRSQMVNTLMAALEERDYITEGHGQRLSHLCQRIGERIGLSCRQLGDLVLLSRVHDLGKVATPDGILFKEGSLTQEEWEIMKEHPRTGYRIALASPDLSGIASLILQHHERWDGSGYPLGIKGEEIPVECRILAIVDAYDAMTNDRPYRNALTKEEAVEELKRWAGMQFDPYLVEIFLEVLKEEGEF